MTTANDQMRMCYQAGREVTKQNYSDFIKKMNKDRFDLVEKLRNEGKLDSEWNLVEEFDKQIERQESIFNGAYGRK
jgi:hypothetical protein